ncbi:nuclear transport factor 2 family protein [Luteimonas sp. SX5]|uniref:Nuclear transport factor 2 family protein n=1 Tax=Luteimonas galliterrae TaxID=2940486 RepID=A0ABT0MKT9_9GAMM|nr:nuclear transport factor 2 family protein [Luteimonas galliterrae]MCL1635504.1 nuclear transport factor 2 family protein [Luteimonas galliterrae]
MSIAQQLGELEFGFWKGTRNYYDEHLATESMAVYPDPVGALSRDEILASIDDGARWQEVELEDMAVIEAAPGMVMVTYRAKASRGDGETYQALVGSVYVKEDGEWKLAFNQQTPA